MNDLRGMLLAGIVIISGCGGGGGATNTGGGNLTPTPTPSPPPPPPPVRTTCSGSDLINVLGASDNGSTPSTTQPELAIDDDLAPTSRWRSQGAGTTLTLDLGARYLVREVGIAWYEGDQRIATFNLLTSEDGTNFESHSTNQQSSGKTQRFERYDISDTPARYIRIENNGNSINTENSIIEATAFGCPLDTDTPVFEEGNVSAADYALDPTVAPGSNFDLLGWRLQTPADLDGNGRADGTSERDLDAGFTDEYFFTGDDGGMVFRSTIAGVTTSTNTRYTRSELRGMLRRGNTGISTQGVNRNNWILGYQPDPGVAVGGRNGVLRATLAVNHVTETGDRNQVGRVIIGQIHAESDEPIRLYYRKYPENERGFVYFAHEIRDSDDIYFTVLGPINDNLDTSPPGDDNIVNGIALDELFSYEIHQRGARIDVILRRGGNDGPIIGHAFVDMEEQNSGYDIATEWMYFKAGAYSQNNSGDQADYDRVTFYELTATHDN